MADEEKYLGRVYFDAGTVDDEMLKDCILQKHIYFPVTVIMKVLILVFMWGMTRYK